MEARATYARKKSHKGQPRYLGDSDVKILLFLWKWKVSTGIVLFHGTAPNEKPRAFNKRLRKLEDNGLIEDADDHINRRRVWQLTEFGFEQIRQCLPNLKDKGFRSPSVDHDFMCLALIFGEWPFERRANPIFFSDQEILRCHEDVIPDWVPKGMSHRPDGYLKLRDGKEYTALAFEAELSFKSVSSYSSAISAYKFERKIERVIWMYRDPYFLSQFIKAKADARDPSSNYHLFMAEADYLKSGWYTALYNERSEKVRTLRELLLGNSGEIPREIAEIVGEISKIGIFSDTRKYLNLKKT